MEKAAVIYRSKYGSTKKYAEWIAKEIDSDLFECSQINAQALSSYNTIIYGGGLYASGINGISFITKNFKKIRDKNIIVFTVGLASTDDKSIFQPIIEKNFTSEMRSNMKFFHLRGAIDYKRLNFIHKIMMAMLKKMISNKNPQDLSDDDKMMLDTYGDIVDFTDIKTIQPLVDYVSRGRFARHR
ncbi:MAG: flavodoxin domain-containing protein [Clostridia bacterium]|nr:flavodoxin domain-containing protein [Clostridia bacterium]